MSLFSNDIHALSALGMRQPGVYDYLRQSLGGQGLLSEPHIYRLPSVTTISDNVNSTVRTDSASRNQLLLLTEENL